MQWIVTHINLIIFGLVIASSVLGPLFKWLGDKRQQLRLENERKRRELDEMRTGRVEPAGPTPEEIERLIAQQVAAQQAEMMRQRAEQAEARRQAARRRAEAQARKQAAQAPSVPKPAVRRPEHVSTLATPPMVPIEALAARAIGSRGAAGGGRRATGAVVLGTLGPGELRWAIVLTEVLGPPVALRDGADRAI